VSDEVERGLLLADAGRWFEAHEAFEEAWRVAIGPRKALLRALVHACVAREHARRGNQTGARLQTEKARARLAEAEPDDPLVAEVRRLLDS
jgi:predicted metal-dependent hydrolase